MPRHSIATGAGRRRAAGRRDAGEDSSRYRDRMRHGRASRKSRTERVESDERALRDIFTQLRVAHRPRLHQLQARHRAAPASSGASASTRLPDLRRVRRASSASTRTRRRRCCKDLLISVTNFFRDRRRVRGAGAAASSRAVRGQGARATRCASGWPAARPARRRTRSRMLLAEHAATLPAAPPCRSSPPTSTSRRSRRAREGCYTLNDAADVSPERLRRFFMQGRRAATASARSCARWCSSRTTTCSRTRRSRTSTWCPAATCSSTSTARRRTG